MLGDWAILDMSMRLKRREILYRAEVKRISRFLQEVDIFAGMSKRNLDWIASL